MHHNHAQQLAYQANQYSDKTNHGDAEHTKNGAKAKHNSHDTNGQNGDQESNDGNGGCSKVNIVKINLPILTSSIHLDEAVYPIIDLSVFNYLADLSQLHEFEDESPFIDDLVPTLRPRDYINTICTLII